MTQEIHPDQQRRRITQSPKLENLQVGDDDVAAVENQRVQVNLYAYGAEKMGHQVEKVALACYPLGGRLDDLHTIIEDYDRQLAVDAIERLDGIKLLVWQLDPENNPSHWSLIPASPAYGCIYCPFYLPNSTDLSVGCPGEKAVA